MWPCGRMLTFMWTCGSSGCYAHAGWGGVGWDVNVHVTLRQDVNVHEPRKPELGWWNLSIPWRNFVAELTSFIRVIIIIIIIMMMMMKMMMMMMMMMKLVNSATKFRHGMDKFYQPNSGLRGSRSGDEAIYTYIYIYDRVCSYIKAIFYHPMCTIVQ